MPAKQHQQPQHPRGPQQPELLASKGHKQQHQMPEKHTAMSNCSQKGARKVL